MSHLTDKEVVSKARHVTWVGFWVNAVLAAIKISAGIVGRSGAMIADGIHSLSDFITDGIVIIFVGLSRKKADEDHAYGHGKYETFATLLIAVALGIVAIGFFADSASKVWSALHGELLPRPHMVALVVAVVSIAAKEWLFRYTRSWGRRLDVQAVVANAWHHRSDAFSSVATLVGIAGAMFLGESWRVLDPIAALVISIFIFAVAVQIARPAVRELLESSLPEADVHSIENAVSMVSGVRAFHHLRTRRNGNKAIVGLHVKVDPIITVEAGHDIATAVEDSLRRLLGDDSIITVHIEPWRG